MILKKYTLIYIAFVLVLVKWSISYSFFSEPINLKIIFESVTDGKYYYPLISYLTEFNFNNSFDPEINNLKIIPIPFSSLIFHALFFKVFNFYSFIILEFISLSILLTLFYNFYRFIFSKNISLILTLIILLSPIIIENTFLYEFKYLKIFSTNLFDFRVPRPMISNLFLFGFILLITKMYIKKFYSYKNFFLLGLILGLSLSSFFYHFFLEIIVFLMLMLVKFNKGIFQQIAINIKYYLVTFFSFSIISIPFLLNLYLHESDFTSRQCVFNLNYEMKLTLLKFYLTKYLNLKYTFVILAITTTILIANLKNFKEKKILNILYLFFISSLITPIFFTIISTKSCVLYHFNNLIIIFALLYLILFFQIAIKSIIIKKEFKWLANFFSLILILFYCLNFYNVSKKNYEDEDYYTYRAEFKILTNKIKNLDKLNKISILTFETDFMIWAIMNDIKYLNLINGLFTSKKDLMIEEDIFSAFKILGLKENNFKKFLNNNNNKSNWRYLNDNISTFFFYKYQANSLTTFKNSLDFESDELNFIKKSSPLLHQQSIIPIFEIERLRNNFRNFNKIVKNPDILILNKKKNFYEPNELKLDNFCLNIDGKKFMLYLNKYKYDCSNEN